jgi:hypothetical protein
VDDKVRLATEALLEREVFQTGGDAEMVARELGYACLQYLEETHVKPKVQVNRDSATSILRVVDGCAPYYAKGEDSAEFELARDGKWMDGRG